jgi:pyruvate-formate lyase-activating enzyme
VETIAFAQHLHGAIEDIDCGLVFRSVGRRTTPLAGVPYDDVRGVHANIDGRVAIGSSVVFGLYVCGWSKRGPSGTIGTNRGCGMATAEAVLADLPARAGQRSRRSRCAAGAAATARRAHRELPRLGAIDAAEKRRGALLGKPREKFVSVADMLAATGVIVIALVLRGIAGGMERDSGREGRQVMSVPFVDGFGRRVKYLRLSVTDRCDLRCRYCMSEAMTFLPSKELLSFDELDRVARCFIASGVEKIRVTGGEPLVRKEIMQLFRRLSRYLADGQAAGAHAHDQRHPAVALRGGTRRALGVRRVNVSLDTLDPDKFAMITRGGSLARVLEGIEAARTAGLAVKLNAVALKGFTEDEIDDLIGFAHAGGMTLTLIETMPLGEIGADRTDQFLPL